MPRDAGHERITGDQVGGGGGAPPDPEGEPGKPPAEADGDAGGARTEGRAKRMAEQLHERRERHRRRSRAYRIAVTAAGFLILLGGIVLAAPGVPGPGFVVILIGLAVLALEFAWAERLLRRGLEYADRAGERAAGMSTRRKWVLALLAAGTIAAAAGAVLVFQIPVPPWS